MKAKKWRHTETVREKEKDFMVCSSSEEGLVLKQHILVFDHPHC